MADKIIILGLFVFFGGAVSLALGLASQRRESAMKKWPTVQGTMVSSQVVRTVDARLRSPAYSRLTPSDTGYDMFDVWALDVAYSYVVEGAAYEGARAVSSWLVQKIEKGTDVPCAELREIQAQFPAGAEVPVHYDPANPAESYLFYRRSPQADSNLKTGLALALVGGVMAVASRVFFHQ